MESKSGNFNFPIIIIIFAVAIGILFLINYPSPVELNSDQQNIEENEQQIEVEEEQIEQEIEIIENPDMPVIEPELPEVVEQIIQEEIADQMNDCPFGKELRSTPENPMTYTCKLITLENGGQFGDVRLSINEGRFEQPEIQVKKGTTVTWIMIDKTAGAGGDVPYHQVTEENGLFDSGFLFVSGDNKFSFVFDEVGEFKYFCPPHPWMEGTIIVVE